MTEFEIMNLQRKKRLVNEAYCGPLLILLPPNRFYTLFPAVHQKYISFSNIPASPNRHDNDG
jgi:hypothetical protein